MSAGGRLPMAVVCASPVGFVGNKIAQRDYYKIDDDEIIHWPCTFEFVLTFTKGFGFLYRLFSLHKFVFRKFQRRSAHMELVNGCRISRRPSRL